MHGALQTFLAGQDLVKLGMRLDLSSEREGLVRSLLDAGVSAEILQKEIEALESAAHLPAQYSLGDSTVLNPWVAALSYLDLLNKLLLALTES